MDYSILKKKLMSVDIKSTKFTVPMTQEYLKRLEGIIGTALPETYRWFLETYSHCRIHAIYPAIDGSKTWTGMIERLHGASSRSSDDIISTLGDYEGRIPSTLLPIGEDAGGNQICLGIRGDILGKVYFWYHGGETIPGEPMATNNTFLVANSFEEFVMSMRLNDY